MSARAIALGERYAYLAPDALNYTKARVSDGAHLVSWHALERAAQLMGHKPGTMLVAGKRTRAAWLADTTEVLPELGWTFTELEPWTTFRHADLGTVHVGFVEGIDYDRTPLFARTDDPADVVRRLAWIHEHIGAPYYMTPGVTGCEAIRRHFDAHARRVTKYEGAGEGQKPFGEPYWGLKDRRDQDDPRTGAGDMMWQRKPRRSDVDAGWVHAYDLTAARLAALGVASLAWGKLRHVDMPAFDPTQAGYWRVHAHDVNEPFPGAIYDPATVRDGMVDLTTPMMEILSRCGMCPTAASGWLAPGRRILRTIGEKWNAARLAAPPGRALATVKAVYREAAGMMAREGGSIFRPDWYHTIMDRQRATLISHILRIKRAAGIMPLIVRTDCLWYPADTDNAERHAAQLAIQLGTGLGKFRVHATHTAATFYRKAQP